MVSRYRNSDLSMVSESLGHDRLKVNDFVISSSGIVYYLIDITCSIDRPLDSYTIRKRYSDFKDFHQRLQKVIKVDRFSLITRFSIMGSDDIPDDPYEELPKMPSGGLWSYFTKYKPSTIQYRIEQFNRILKMASLSKNDQVKNLFNEFIKEAPGTRQRTYTSLHEYAATEIRLSVERKERRRAASTGRHSVSESKMLPPIKRDHSRSM